jgi:AraC-like DNA-binding protein
MVQAVLAQATGCYHERPAVPSLGGTFACTWIHRMPKAGAPPIIVTPDGNIDLQWIEGSFRVAGPDKGPQTEILPAGAIIIGFRFRPAAAGAWLGLSASELLDQRVALEELWGTKARRLAAGVPEQGDVAGLVTSLEAALTAHRASHAADAPMRAAFDLIRQGSPPDASLVPWLMRALSMSERTLRRRFDQNFGYGPKTLDRILRYQRFLHLARRSRQPTAIQAAEAGYADQAHLVRESRRMTGSTPLQLDRIIHARRNGEGY